MTWAELRTQAIEQAALNVLADPNTDEASRRDARAELEQGEVNYDRFTLPELDVWIDLIARATGQPIADDHAHVAERARSYQEAANARRDEMDLSEPIGPRIAAPRCRRCAEFSDDDLQVLREACAEEIAESKILNPGTTEITDGQ